MPHPLPHCPLIFKKNTFSVSYHSETDLYSRGINLSHFVKWLSSLLERKAIIRSNCSVSYIYLMIDKTFEISYKQICQSVETGIIVDNSRVTVF